MINNFLLLLSIGFFIVSTGELKSQEALFGQDFSFDNQNLSSKEYYKLIYNFNKNNSENLIQKRSNYTHQIDTVIGFEPDQTKTLIPITKGKIIFDDDNLKEILAAWLREGLTWVQYFYNVYHFNKIGLITKSTYNLWSNLDEEWSEDNAQILRFYEYDEDNRVTRFYSKDQQDIILNKFSSESIYNYDSLGQLTNIDLFLGRW